MSKVHDHAVYWSDKDLEDLQDSIGESAYIEDQPLCGGDVIESPKHYTHSSIETIDAIEAWKLDYHLGNVVKYISRAKHKGNELQDLRKAEWYLKRAIEKRSKP